MSMLQPGSMIKRFGDVCRANILALIKEGEDPEKMVELFLHDASVQYRELEIAVAADIAQKNTIVSKRNDASDDVSKWAAYADKSVKSSKPEEERKALAMEALANKKKAAERLADLEEQLARVEARLKKGKARLESLRDEIRDAKENGEDLINRLNSAKAEKNLNDALAKISGSPLDGFKSIEEKVKIAEAQAAASSEAADIRKGSAEDKFKALDGDGLEDEYNALVSAAGKGKKK